MIRANPYLILLPVLLLFAGGAASGQNFAYVDTEYILDNVPEYQEARTELQEAAQEWRDEINRKKEGLSELKTEFEAEKVLLPDDIKEQRRQEISEKEKAIDQYREEKFGSGGELYQKRDRLLEPIQDRVFEAVQEVARDGGLDFIFDRSGSVTMLYYSARYDRSDEVLLEMGIDPPDEREEEEEEMPGQQDDDTEPDVPDIEDDDAPDLEDPSSVPDDGQRRMPRPDDE